jgi:hypothetical protein
MSQFIAQSSVKKRQINYLVAVGFIATGLAMMIVQFFSHRKGLGKLLDWLIGISFIINGISRIWPQKKSLFVSITDDQINWIVQEKSAREVIIPWREIQWIKQEPTGSITCYQQSSFSENLSLFAFSEEQRLTIKQEIQNMAAHHGIRLVNF